MKLIPALWILKPLHAISPLLELLVSGILAGVLIGISIAIALNAKCATGGTDVLALIIQHFMKDVKVEKIILVLDGIIIVGSGIVTANVLISIFSFISLVVISQTIKSQTNPSKSL